MGESTGYPGEAYFVLYGTKADGTPDANILTKTEPSYETYFVCDSEGNIISKLSEIDPVNKEELSEMMGDIPKKETIDEGNKQL